MNGRGDLNHRFQGSLLFRSERGSLAGDVPAQNGGGRNKRLCPKHLNFEHRGFRQPLHWLPVAS